MSPGLAGGSRGQGVRLTPPAGATSSPSMITVANRTPSGRTMENRHIVGIMSREFGSGKPGQALDAVVPNSPSHLLGGVGVGVWDSISKDTRSHGWAGATHTLNPSPQGGGKSRVNFM